MNDTIIMNNSILPLRFGEFAADEKDGAPLVMNRKLKVATETYSFKSSIIHEGVSKHNGHFICSALCPTGRCVEFDDHKVLPLPCFF